MLNGSKCFISVGAISGLIIVMARTSAKSVSAFLVEKGTKGLTYGKVEEKLGWKASPTVTLMFEDMRVNERSLLGKDGDGFKIAMKGLDGGRINIASCSLGAAGYCMELAREHILVRKQFGKPLGHNQYLQFKFAEMATHLTASTLMIRNAANLLD